jgi:hypothetical protein
VKRNSKQYLRRVPKQMGPEVNLLRLGVKNKLTTREFLSSQPHTKLLAIKCIEKNQPKAYQKQTSAYLTG